MKKLIVASCLSFLTLSVFAQNNASKSDKKIEKRKKEAAMIRQEEEGVLSYHKQNTFGIQLRTNGYGVFFEKGIMKTPRFTNLYMIELTEIKHPKERKNNDGQGAFSNSYVYGKEFNFYQLKLGFGQQYIFGQKGNKNGIAVMGIYEGGLSLGLLRPYYLDIDDGSRRSIKYNSPDSLKFLDLVTGSNIVGSSGLSKGWNELKVKPGAFIKAALRFDFNKYNEKVQAVQIGLSLEAYPQKVNILVSGPDFPKPKNLFIEGHLAFVFGGRK
ncbi:MAG: hypothetical protein JWP88_800 [Flaviaesturariibacter sp.]|nr:hypothetical protein [Flaviaesturariibacter sp.]